MTAPLMTPPSVAAPETTNDAADAADATSGASAACESRPTADRPFPEARLELWPPERLPDVLALWQRLDLEHPTPHLTARADWNAAWCEAFAEEVTIWTAVRRCGPDESSHVTGLWLLPVSRHRRMGPLRLRTVHVGTAGESAGESVFVEHNRPFVVGGGETAFLRDLLALLGNEARRRATGLPRFDRIDLDGVPRSLLPSECLVPEAVNASGLPIEVEVRESPVQHFPQPIDDDAGTGRENGRPCSKPLAGLRRKTRSNFRRAMKNYDRVETTWHEGPEALAALQTLVDLHQSRWEAVGQPGAFGGRCVRPFYERLLRSGLGTVAVAADDEGPIGATLLMPEDDRQLCLIVGFADTTVRTSPGLVSLVPIQQAACERGAAGFEFLVGDNLYKRMLSNDRHSLVWAQVPGPSIRYRVFAWLRGVNRHLKRLRETKP